MAIGTHKTFEFPPLFAPGDRITVVLHSNRHDFTGPDAMLDNTDRNRVEGGTVDVTVVDANLLPDLQFPDVPSWFTVADPWISVWRDGTLLCVSGEIPNDLRANGPSFDFGAHFDIL